MAREVGAYVFALDHPDLATCAGLHTPKHPCDGKRGKHPCVKFTLDATNTVRDIVAVFAGTTRNYGVATRQSRVLVLDVDDAAALAAFLHDRGETLLDTL